MSERTTCHSLEERLHAVLQVLDDHISISQLARELKVDPTTIQRWVRRYQSEGPDGLKESHHWRQYSAELKEAAVRAYLNGTYTFNECCREFKITSGSVLRKWVNQYTSPVHLIAPGEHVLGIGLVCHRLVTGG